MRFPFCQFIAGEPSFNDACKCGRKVKPGSPYCPEHHAHCYQAAETVEAQEGLREAAA